MKRIFLISAVAFVLFLSLSVSELLQSNESISIGLVLLDLAETGLLVLAVALTAYLAIEMRDLGRQRANLIADLEKAEADGNRWRAAARVHIDGLGRAIKDQFDEWALTEGESDIAMLMLKGMSHKEIANVRNSREATVRRQAQAIYRKSKLPSRAALAAFFLEDLLPPQGSDDDVRTSSNVAPFDRNGRIVV